MPSNPASLTGQSLGIFSLVNRSDEFASQVAYRPTANSIRSHVRLQRSKTA